ncbi:MAG: 5'/3'-nucleotidase SurE [Gammaproteobacteria bacterium]
MSKRKLFADSRILLTNDDGIDAPGIKLLEELVRELTDDVWIVAPDHEKSGASHSISLHIPIRLRRTSEKGYAVIGTPTDCVLMAFHEILKDRKPTVVLSGINSGANLAEDVTYSGTIAAAMEGALLGVRSIALSVVRPLDGQANWDGARKYAPDLLRKLLGTKDWPEASFVNINFPECGADEISGVRVTRQGRRPPGAFSIDPRVDNRQVPYYWVKLSYPQGAIQPETDLHAIQEKAVSVTPIQLDFTHTEWRERLRSVWPD